MCIRSFDTFKVAYFSQYLNVQYISLVPHTFCNGSSSMLVVLATILYSGNTCNILADSILNGNKLYTHLTSKSLNGNHDFNLKAGIQKLKKCPNEAKFNFGVDDRSSNISDALLVYLWGKTLTRFLSIASGT